MSNGAMVAWTIVVTNDVRALTVAEHWFGVGVNADSFAVVTIGSGIGCGLYINGEVVSGAYGVSGELGHLPLAPGNLVCTCGRRGCVETVASSDAILARTRETTGRADLDLAGAIKLAHEGDEHAREAFDRAGEVIGAALASGTLWAVAHFFLGEVMSKQYPDTAFISPGQTLILAPALIGLGVVLAGISSLLTLRRYLRV